MEKEYNYTIYALFNKEITEFISDVMDKIQNRYAKYLKYKTTEAPHITISYGPSINDSNMEIKNYNQNAINDLLNGFVDKFYGNLPIVNYTGIICLDRKKINGFTVIGIEYNSDILTSMREYIYDIPSMNIRRLNEKEKIFKSGVINDETYDKPPKGWAHVTIAVVNTDAPIDDIINDIADLIKNFDKNIGISKIQLISAVNDIPIDLW